MLKAVNHLVVFLLFPLFAFLQNSSQALLLKIENAFGGKSALQNIQTLQFKSSLQVNVMGQSFTIGINNIKDNGKLCRRETNGMFGMKGSVLLISDTGMYTAVPDMSNFGETPNAVNKIEQASTKEYLLSKYLLETQGYFAPLIDCYSKGNKFEIIETKKVNGIECIKTALTLISKQQIIYYINSSTFLVEQAEIEGESAMVYLGLGGMMKSLMSRRMDKLKLTISYSNYKKFGDVLFPTKEIIAVGANDFVQETNEFIINKPIEDYQYILKQ